MNNEDCINIKNQEKEDDSISIEDGEIVEDDDCGETFKDQDNFILSECANPNSNESAPELG